ncbi:MAG TPA: gluconate 2-dehydrogenase subunit 3 family protein [Terriglobales bacterium]|nr:gluconate 2-dehydrogenase subunit 3 family protein [Terriglobales bacterium]
MSLKNPIDLRQDRRQWLITSAGVLGASLLPVSDLAASALQVPTPPVVPHGTVPEAQSPATFFTSAQHALVEELAETIIPADSRSGGAKAAKVADFIDQFLRETSDDAEKSVWRDGLPLIEVMCRHYHGKSFVDSTPEERVAILTVLSDHAHLTDLPEVRFFNSLKRMTVDGYYTSKIGIHDELQYKGNRINMEFVGCDDQPPAKS